MKSGDRTATSRAEEALARAEQTSDLDAFVHLDAEHVLAQARAIDAKVAAGEDVGPLAGVPVVLKDNLLAKGEPATCASRAGTEARPTSSTLASTASTPNVRARPS